MRSANSVDTDEMFQEQSDLDLHCFPSPFFYKKCVLLNVRTIII